MDPSLRSKTAQGARKVADARPAIYWPARNFATLKIDADEGTNGLSDATLKGRELAMVDYIKEHVLPRLTQSGTDRGYLALSVSWRFLVARTGYHIADCGRCYSAMGESEARATTDVDALPYKQRYGTELKLS